MSDLPKINRKLFQKVYDQIVAHPEAHDQANWEYGGDLGVEECGTTRCVGGWALVIHTGRPTVFAAAASLVDMHDPMLIRTAARGVLGLTRDEATALFYGLSNDQAIELCRRYATGGRASARRYIKSINI